MFRDNEPQLREMLLERSSSKEKCVERIKAWPARKDRCGLTTTCCTQQGEVYTPIRYCRLLVLRRCRERKETPYK